MLSLKLTPVRAVLLMLSLLMLVGSVAAIRDTLAYDQLRVADGEVWRILSAWLAQLNVRHWLLNQWGLVLLLLLLPARLTVWGWLGFILIWLSASAALAVSDYVAYVGLSGLLYGWLLWALYLSPFYVLWIRLTVAAALCLKVLTENGLLPGAGSDWVATFIGAPVAHESHLWGLLSGLAVCALALTVGRYRSVRARRG